MSRRRNTAVMASSRKSAASKLNYFPTPPWAVRALLHEVLLKNWRLGTAWEPACGGGHCAIPLGEVFEAVFASDVFDWGYGDRRDLDFSLCGPETAPFAIDWVISNPPFILAEMFVRRGLVIARTGVAMLMRLQWLEGQERWREFFAPGGLMPVLICPFAERVPMIEGAWDPEAKSATGYAWFIWTAESLAADRDGRHRRTEVLHFPPGMEDRYTRLADEALANRGEAARRRAAEKLLLAKAA